MKKPRHKRYFYPARHPGLFHGHPQQPHRQQAIDYNIFDALINQASTIGTLLNLTLLNLTLLNLTLLNLTLLNLTLLNLTLLNLTLLNLTLLLFLLLLLLSTVALALAAHCWSCCQ